MNMNEQTNEFDPSALPFPVWLRRVMTERRLGVNQLAAQLAARRQRVGASMISAYRYGKVLPKEVASARLADYFGVERDYVWSLIRESRRQIEDREIENITKSLPPAQPRSAPKVLTIAGVLSDPDLRIDLYDGLNELTQEEWRPILDRVRQELERKRRQRSDSGDAASTEDAG